LLYFLTTTFGVKPMAINSRKIRKDKERIDKLEARREQKDAQREKKKEQKDAVRNLLEIADLPESDRTDS
jgi:hypothetical protein